MTYAARLTRRDSAIDWSRSAEEIHNQIRGAQPWPLAGAMLKGRRVMFLQSAVADRAGDVGTPGKVVAVDSRSFTVGTGNGSVRILDLQEAGRAAMTVAAFLNGRRVAIGEELAPLSEAPG